MNKKDQQRDNAPTYTIRQILTGYQLLDKGLYATFRKGVGQIVKHPVYAFLVEGDGKKYLVDTGMSSTEQSVEYHHDGSQEQGQAIHEQLERVGVLPDEIDAVIFTHLHWDHCSNMEKFTNAAFHVSREEYEFAINPIPPYWASYEHPDAGLTPPFSGCRFELFQGEQEIFDGISVFPTPGHSPGHAAVSVRTEKGRYVIVGDLMFVRENMEPDEERGWPMLPPGRFYNLVEIWHSMERAVQKADYILMTHDPLQMECDDVYPNDSDDFARIAGTPGD